MRLHTQSEAEIRKATRIFLDRVFAGPLFRGQVITPDEYDRALEKIVGQLKFLERRIA